MNAPDRIRLGLVRDMPATEYHSILAMSASGLKRMRQSPAHFYGTMLDPERPPASETPALSAGTLFHAALFEPGALALRYAVRPAGTDLRTKEGKAWAESVGGKIIVTAAEMSAALTQARNVGSLPDIAALMADGYAESSAFWLDERTGELCKCRPDWVSPAGEGVILVDGKSAQDASPDGFGRAIWNYCYHLQAAWYSDGFERATGLRVHGFVFAAVESAWPHAAAAYMLGDDVLDKARAENRHLLDRYAECRRTGIWPGYPAGIEMVNLPAWAQRQLENA